MQPELKSAVEAVRDQGWVVLEEVASLSLFDQLKEALDPLLATALLGPHFQISIISAIQILPGETAQDLHTDDGLYPLPWPHPPVVLNTMWAIDDFTEANGATRLAPGSHQWPERGSGGSSPEGLQRLVGYDLHPPFIGNVDGRNPLKLLRRS